MKIVRQIRHCNSTRMHNHESKPTAMLKWLLLSAQSFWRWGLQSSETQTSWSANTLRLGASALSPVGLTHTHTHTPHARQIHKWTHQMIEPGLLCSNWSRSAFVHRAATFTASHLNYCSLTEVAVKVHQTQSREKQKQKGQSQHLWNIHEKITLNLTSSEVSRKSRNGHPTL